METGSINLKKYTSDNLSDYDLDYKRIENEKTLSWFYEVYLNNKLVGIINCEKADSYNRQRILFMFNPVPDSVCLHMTSAETLQGVKSNINDQIKNPINFIQKYWDNK